MKPKLGQKECPKCYKIYGTRKIECNCGHIFIFKKHKPKQKKDKVTNVNWQELQSGDRIKVYGGPYYIDKESRRVSLGTCGTLIVKKIDKEGIICTGKFGTEFIYMGPRKNSWNVIRVPHIIKKLK